MELYIKKKLNNVFMIYLPILIVILIVGYFTWYFIFNIYDVKVSISNNDLFADNQSTTEIYVYPINYFGKKVPFREVISYFDITEGQNLVEIIDKKDNKIVIKSKNNSGMVKIIIKNKYNLFPIVVDLVIKANFA